MFVPNYITPNGLERLRRELAWLDGVERPRVVAEVQYAASMGDRSENAEYIYGKKRLRKIDGRRRFLIKRLEKVRVVDPVEVTTDVVRFGATVVIEDEDGVERTWRIYGEDEVDVEGGVLSWKSPLAKAIFGKREGDDATFRAPGGMREVLVLRVAYDAQASLPEDVRFTLE